MTTEVLNPPLKTGSRPSGAMVDTIVLHATAGGSLSGAVQTLRLRGLSYHYLIEKDGTVTKCCAASRAAYHSGLSSGPQGKWCNRYSVGISFVNLNNGSDPYTKEQFSSAMWLIKELKKQFPLEWITTHYWVSPGRKTDPKGYPVHNLASNTGLKVWKPRG